MSAATAARPSSLERWRTWEFAPIVGVVEADVHLLATHSRTRQPAEMVRIPSGLNTSIPHHPTSLANPRKEYGILTNRPLSDAAGRCGVATGLRCPPARRLPRLRRYFVDPGRATPDNDSDMNSKTLRREKPLREYPPVTHGSRVAARGRQKANKMSDAQREEYFRKGMVMIYGHGLPKKAVVGH